MSKPRKLTLNRETIRTLHQAEIAGVHGGTTPATTVVGPVVLTAGVATAAVCQPAGNWVLDQAGKGFPVVSGVKKVAGAVGAAGKAVGKQFGDAVGAVKNFTHVCF